MNKIRYVSYNMVGNLISYRLFSYENVENIVQLITYLIITKI